jgi:phage/plasmid-like protein (TIGR03299 family)
MSDVITPWTRYGHKFDSNATAIEMEQVTGTGWEIAKAPMFYEWEGKMIPCAEKALVRGTDGHKYSTVTEDWHAVSNRRLWELFEEMCKNKNGSQTAKMHSGGTFNDGQLVWACAEINNPISLFGGDVMQPYLLGIIPHKYGSSIEFSTTTLRFACTNMLTRIHRDAEVGIRINHRRAFDSTVVMNLIAASKSDTKQYKSMAEYLSSRKYNPQHVIDYFKKIFPYTTAEGREEGAVSRAASLAIAAVDIQPGGQYKPGTFWSLYNAATYTVDHIIGKDVEKRMVSNLHGANRDKKVRALNLAVQMADAA